MVAQLSSKVFLGDKICRNPDWLRITVDYTVDTFLAAEDLRLWPRLMRPIMANFLPSCRKIRRELKEATEIITPVLEERRRDLEAARKANQPPKRYDDAMQWMEECAKGRPYPPAEAQMAFSIVAIHTTSDMLTQVLLGLCAHLEVIRPLREEIVAVIQEEGWKKTALYKLKLMDSVLKESQRMKPVNISKNFYPLSSVYIS
jgi:cytochrome P450